MKLRKFSIIPFALTLVIMLSLFSGNGIKVEACSHNYQYKKTVSPTCTTAGYKLYKCSKCTATKTVTTTSALGHNYKLKTTKNPTCVIPGHKTYECSRCSSVKNETLKALGHKWGKNYTSGENIYKKCTRKNCIGRGCVKVVSHDTTTKSAKLTSNKEATLKFNYKVHIKTIKNYKDDGLTVKSIRTQYSITKKDISHPTYSASSGIQTKCYKGLKQFALKLVNIPVKFVGSAGGIWLAADSNSPHFKFSYNKGRITSVTTLIQYKDNPKLINYSEFENSKKNEGWTDEQIEALKSEVSDSFKSNSYTDSWKETFK